MPADHPSPAPPEPTRRAHAIAAATGALLALTALIGAPVGSAEVRAPAHPGASTEVSPAHPAADTADTADTAAAHAAPVADARVVSAFRPPARRWSAGHRGVDLAAAPGDPVLAPAPGVVTFQGVVVDRSVVVLTHPDGLRTSLEPVVGSLPLGSTVVRGDVVGAVEDRPGHCPERCVHWGVRRGQDYLDPLSLLAGAGPVVLLPVPP